MDGRSGRWTLKNDAAIFPHPRSLSPRERDAKPFSLREKGGDEGTARWRPNAPEYHEHEQERSFR